MVVRSIRSKSLGWMIAAICFFLVCLSSGAAYDAQSEAAEHFAAAQRAQNAGSLDTAAQEYLKVIQLFPSAAEAYASLGMVYNAQGKYAESADALSKAEKLKPSLPGVSLYLGIDLLKQHKTALAIPHLQRAVQIEPKNGQAYTWLSQAYSEDDRLDPALEYLQKAAVLYPSEPALLLDLGRLYRRAGDERMQHVLVASGTTPLHHLVYGDIYQDQHSWANARAHYYKALEQDPKVRGAHFGLAEIAFKNQEVDLSVTEYRKELEVNPASAAATARLAEVALLQGKPGEALPLFTSAVKIAPAEAAHALGLPRSLPADPFQLSKEQEEHLRNSLPALASASPSPGQRLAVALVELRLGQDASFTADWKKYQDSAPRSIPGTEYQRAVVAFDGNDLSAAETSLHAWLKLHPEDLQARYLLARTYQALSSISLEKLLATAPDSYPAHQALAKIYEEELKTDKALEEYKLVEQKAPNLPGLHLSIASLLLKLNRDDEALTELDTELRLNPDNAQANAVIGNIYMIRADSAKAIPYLERAVQRDANLSSARQQLGKAYYMQKEYAKAITQLQDAVRSDTDGSVHFQLGLTYRAMGQTAKAGEQFEISRKLKLASLSHSETELNTLQGQSK